MEVASTVIAEVKVIKTEKHSDNRGFFSEIYNKQSFSGAGFHLEFVQDNHSFSASAGVVRGLHFQVAPFVQCKLVRVVRGKILDVAVDLRRGSPTFGKYVAATLSRENWNQLFVPVGFAHGFCTLESGTEVIYKVSNYYSAACDRGLFWNDPELDIPWPVSEGNAILSEKDRRLPRFSQLVELFDYRS